MVAIGDIQGRHGFKSPRNCCDSCRITHYPDFMADTVFGRNIRYRVALSGVGDKFIYCAGCRVSQQYRAGLRIQSFNLTHAIVFLFRAGEFMLADPIAVVIRHTGRCYEARLAMRTHGQTIDVIAGRIILNEHACREHFG